MPSEIHNSSAGTAKAQQPVLNRAEIDAVLSARFGRADLTHPYFSMLHAICRSRLEAGLELPEYQQQPAQPQPGTLPPMQISIESLFERQTTILALPEAVEHLRSVLNNPESTADEIADAIRTDPQLTASLLRIVNSPLYRPVIRVDSVTRAVTLLGTRQIHSLVLGSSLVRNIHKQLGSSPHMMRFWRHSIATAVGAAALARHMGVSETEPFFVAGLLHDIGRLFILSSYPYVMELAVYNAIRNGLDLYLEEMRLMGYDHSAIGAHLLEQWDLSENIVRAVAAHHCVQPKAECLETCAVHLADLLSKAMGYHPSGDYQLLTLSDAAWSKITIAPGEMSEICDLVVSETEGLYHTMFA